MTNLKEMNKQNSLIRIESRIRARWFIGALFLFFGLFILLHLNHFLVPESDFFDYAEKAVQLRHLEWPDNFKRPPLTSLLIAFISPLIPGKFAELYAAEMISAASALFSLWFLWRIARFLQPASAPWVVWFWALHASTLKLAIKPKGEFLFTCLLLWAFDRFLRKDWRAYGAGFLSSTVRYEGAMGIGAFGLADLIFGRQRIKTLLLTLASGSFLVLWSLLSSGGDGGGSYADYFAHWQPNLSFFPAFWSELLEFLPLSGYRFGAIAAALFFAAGAVDLWRRDRRATLALATYLAGFAALHVIWPFPGADYLVMAAWVPLLFIWAGLFAAGRFAGEWLEKRGVVAMTLKRPSLILALTIGAAAVVLALLVKVRFPYPQYQPQMGWVALSLLPLLIYYRPKSWSAAHMAQTTAILTLALFFSFRFFSAARSGLFDVYYSKAEFRLIGEWFDQSYQNGDRLLVSQPNIVAYFTRLDTRRDFVRLSDVPDLPPRELHAWMRNQGITHAAWMSYSLKSEKSGAWHQWAVKNRGLTALDFLGEEGGAPGFVLIKKLEAGPRRAAIYGVLNEYK
jgi:hypothetical protein